MCAREHLFDARAILPAGRSVRALADAWQGEPYMDPHAHERKWKLEQKKKNLTPEGFKYSSPNRERARPLRLGPGLAGDGPAWHRLKKSPKGCASSNVTGGRSGLTKA